MEMASDLILPGLPYLHWRRRRLCWHWRPPLSRLTECRSCHQRSIPVLALGNKYTLWTSNWTANSKEDPGSPRSSDFPRIAKRYSIHILLVPVADRRRHRRGEDSINTSRHFRLRRMRRMSWSWLSAGSNVDLTHAPGMRTPKTRMLLWSVDPIEDISSLGVPSSQSIPLPRDCRLVSTLSAALSLAVFEEWWWGKCPSLAWQLTSPSILWFVAWRKRLRRWLLL